MRLFGRAAARRGGPGFDRREGCRDCIDSNVEAEALGFHRHRFGLSNDAII
jgi:hypothetical protein